MRRVEDRDLEAALARRGGDLGADPAGADDDDRAAAIQAIAQRVGVLDAAQVQHAVELGARGSKAVAARRRWRAAAGRSAAARRRRAPARCRQGSGSPPCARGAARRRARRRSPRVHVDRLAVDLPAQVVLGQRRAYSVPCGCAGAPVRGGPRFADSTGRGWRAPGMRRARRGGSRAGGPGLRLPSIYGALSRSLSSERMGRQTPSRATTARSPSGGRSPRNTGWSRVRPRNSPR